MSPIPPIVKPIPIKNRAEGICCVMMAKPPMILAIPPTIKLKMNAKKLRAKAAPVTIKPKTNANIPISRGMAIGEANIAKTINQTADSPFLAEFG